MRASVLKIRMPVLCLSVCVLSVSLFFYSGAVIEGVRKGLSVCGNALIPSLFPFLCISAFLIRADIHRAVSLPLYPVTRWLLKIPKGGEIVYLLSLVGGYPTAARAAAQLVSAGQLDPYNAELMLCFCFSAGPAFLIGSVGTVMLGSTLIGVYLYLSQIISSLIIGIFLRKRYRYSMASATPVQKPPVSSALFESVSDGSAAMLSVCSFVLLFSALTAVLSSCGATQWFSQLTGKIPRLGEDGAASLLFGIFEVTAGCSQAAASLHPNIYLIVALVSFGGISVHCQIGAAVYPAKIRTRAMLLSRFIAPVLSVIVLWVLFQIAPVDVSVYLSTAPAAAISGGGSVSTSVAMALLAAGMILCAPRSGGNRPLSF